MDEKNPYFRRTLKRRHRERLDDLQEEFVVAVLDVPRAEGLEPAHGGVGGIAPGRVDQRQVLHVGLDELHLIINKKVAEEDARALEVHLDGDDDETTKEKQVLGHAVVERHRLERQRVA